MTKEQLRVKRTHFIYYGRKGRLLREDRLSSRSRLNKGWYQLLFIIEYYVMDDGGISGSKRWVYFR